MTVSPRNKQAIALLCEVTLCRSRGSPTRRAMGRRISLGHVFQRRRAVDVGHVEDRLVDAGVAETAQQSSACSGVSQRPPPSVAHHEREQHRLLDLVVGPALALAVLLEHVELVAHGVHVVLVRSAADDVRRRRRTSRRSAASSSRPGRRSGSAGAAATAPAGTQRLGKW